MSTQNIFLEGSIQNPIALSVFKCPILVADGKIRVVLDLYTCKPDLSGMSIVEDLTKHLIYFKKCNDVVENRVTIFEIFDFYKDLQKVVQDMEKAGVGEKLFIFGTEKRVMQNVFVYKKDLE